jgi:hypothetical protein
MWLRQSTAVDLGIGAFVNNVDEFTPSGGLTITQPDIRLKKNNGNWAQKNASQTLLHEENGWYELSLNETDTNTLGSLIVAVSKADTLPISREFSVVPSNVWDSYFSSSNLDVNVASMNNNVITSGTLAASAIDKIADGIWDEVLTGATHNISSSAGRRLRVLADNNLDDGVAQSGNADLIQLATTASTTPGLYVGCQIAIVGGTGAGQSRYIVGYTAGRVAYVSRHWIVTPNATSEYAVYADNQVLFIHMGLAQGGDATHITLQSTASSINNIYKGQVVRVLSGTGDDQMRSIIAYDGISKIAEVGRAWEVPPDNTSYYGTSMTGSDVYVGAIDQASILAIVDSLLKRDMSAISGEAARSLLNAIRKLMNKWSITGTVLTVTKEDDATPAFTQNITNSPGADPIVGLDTVG